MKKYFIVSLLVALSLVLTGMANAASTIGTNMSTTGTFTQTVGSATAARFQNAAGTVTVLLVDTTNTRVGVAKTPGVKFEVGGTASAAYLFTHNSLQVSGTTGASVAYSRFGTGTTGNSVQLDAANDLLITGALEVDGKAFLDGTASVASNFEVGGTASVSGVFGLNDGQIRPGGNSATAFRFQNAAGTTTVLTIDTTNGKVGIGKTPATTFDVKGTASAAYGFFDRSLQVAGATGVSVAWSRFGTGAANRTTDIDTSNDLYITGALEVDGKSFFDGTASVGGAFEVTGYASASSAFVTTSFVVGSNVASSTTAYNAEFGGSDTGTVSFLFGGNSSSKGTCLQMKTNGGKWVYLRIKDSDTGVMSSMSLVINRTPCHD